MIRMLEWLLGLDRISLDGDAPLAIRFATPPAPWIMLFGAIFAAALVILIYRRETVGTRWRRILSILRFGVIMTALMLLSQPVLVLRRYQVEPSVVAVLVDRSTSMAETDTGDGAAQTRWQAAVDALAGEQGALNRVVNRHHGSIWTFGSSVERLGSVEAAPAVELLHGELSTAPPDADRTDIVGALSTVLDRTQAEPVAGVILVSDGRQTTGASLEGAVARARARSVPVHVVTAGSSVPRKDVIVTSVWVEEDVLVHDDVKVSYHVNWRGYSRPVQIDLELRHRDTGDLIDKQNLDAIPGTEGSRGEFRFQPDSIGQYPLRVVAVPRKDEQTEANNHADIDVRAHDEKIAVLYVESEPRYEYRYLKNLLLREPTIACSCLLLGATPGFTQEGTRPIRQFPQSVEELGEYDVVVFGDVDPAEDWISPAQESLLVDFVSMRGGGLAFIAGELSMPQSLSRTRLERLLPVKIGTGRGGTAGGTIVDPVMPELTPDGREHEIFRFGLSASEARRTFASLPGWYWIADVAGPQPGATVLAHHPIRQADDGRPIPIAVLGRYGAGRTFFLGTDDTWRWRETSGEVHYEKFWEQVFRTLARNHKLGARRTWRLETDRRHYDHGMPVRIRATVAPDDAGSMSGLPVLVRDDRNAVEARIILERAASGDDVFAGTYVPQQTGRYALTADMPVDGDRVAEATWISVMARNPEQDRPEADHAFLTSLARQTGGSVQSVDADLSAMVASIPDRSVQVPDDIEEPLWDSKLVFVFFIVLVSAEWILRKAAGLV